MDHEILEIFIGPCWVRTIESLGKTVWTMVDYGFSVEQNCVDRQIDAEIKVQEYRKRRSA